MTGDASGGTGASYADSARAVSGDVLGLFPLAVDGGIFGWAAGAEDTIAVLDAFYAGGGRVIATADHYAGGRSEVMIGGWLASRGIRDEMIVATRVGRHPDARGLGERAVLTAVNASLRRLGTDRIDVLSFDGDDPGTPVDESLETVDRLRRAGKVRFLSASGYSGARIDEISRLAGPAAYPQFVTVLAEYSLLRREQFEDDLAPVLIDLGIEAIARLPLASGYLDGRHRSREELPESPMFMGALEHVGRRGSRVLDAAEKVAREQSASVSAVAIAWVLSRPGVGMAMIRAARPEQVAELLGGAQVRLTRQQIAALERASS